MTCNECGCCGTATNLFSGAEAIPSDGIILFDGKDLSNWVKRGGGEAGWKVENGCMEVVPTTGDICSKKVFTDCQLHVEFWLPLMADCTGQARSNSGVYLEPVPKSHSRLAGSCGA